MSDVAMGGKVEAQRRRILVAIANHGTKNDRYAERVIDEYRAMPFDVDIVVLSNMEKDWGPDVEIRVGDPAADPRTHPFGHRALFADRKDDYELFVYTEDDTLLERSHLESFLRVSEILPDGKIAGFVRQEESADGERFICSAHSGFHWDPTSILTIGDHCFGHFTNDHSACYLLTREQLRRAINSGGFLVPPHQGRYDHLVTAATDPYTQCGLERVICVSHFDEFVLRHLANSYLGRLGTAREEFERQIVAINDIVDGRRPEESLMRTETRAFHLRWSKSYYEPVDEDLIERLRGPERSVLSVGCGWGATEQALLESGHRIVAVALDPVIAACAEARGLDVLWGAIDDIQYRLRGQSFDVIYVSNLFHLADDPPSLLSSFDAYLRQGGRWMIRSHNFGYIRTLQGRLLGQEGYRALGDFETVLFHPFGRRSLSRWLAQVRARTSCVVPLIPRKYRRLNTATLGVFSLLLSRSVLVEAIKASVLGRRN